MVLSVLVYASVIIGILLYLLIVLVPYVITLLLPPRPRAHFMRILTLYLGRVVIYGALRPFVRIRYADLATDATAPGIYVCNHRAATDAFLVAALGREAIQIVNGWPMKLPFFGFNARLNGYLDATRTAVEDYPRLTRELLDQNVSIIAFPEGTRSGSPQMNAFHSGIFQLARELQVPVYPVCIAGNERFPDRSFRFHSTRTILIRRLPPILPETYSQYPSAFVFKKRVHDLIATTTAEMDAEINRH